MTEPAGAKAPDDPERTVIRPQAGRAPRRPPAAASEPAGPRTNPLLRAAAPLLQKAQHLQGSPHRPDPQGLRQSLADAIKRFDANLRAWGVPEEQAIAARYVVCVLLDEASGPLGSGADARTSRSLLMQFHGESWGGERVFELLSRLRQDPETHRDLLGLMQQALAHGLMGRYRAADDGRAQLDRLIGELHRLLEPAPAPSRPAAAPAGPASTPAPRRAGAGFWFLVAAAATALAAALALWAPWGSPGGPAAGVDRGFVSAPATVPRPGRAPTLATLLASDIAAGNLEVRELADRSIITLPGDGLFAAGSDELQDAQKPLLARVGSALASLPGQLLISGHMDSSPIESPRFPSHWHLSKARAQRVRDALAERVDPARLTVEGRADTEPVDDNGSAGGRAHNRRVEIRWLHAAPADGAAR